MTLRAAVLLAAVLAPAPARAGDLWTVVLPFGLPQFVQHRPIAGAAYAAVQGAGAAGAVWTGLALGNALDEEQGERFDRWRLPNALCVTALAGGWFVSAVDALHARDVASREQADRARAWDAARVEAVAALAGPVPATP